MQRPRATPELRLVFHPEADDGYRHFDGHETVPFDAGAATVTRAHSWWLARKPRCSPTGIRTRRGDASPPPAWRPSSWSDAQVYVAAMPGAVIVVFRGTEPDKLGDSFDDASPW